MTLDRVCDDLETLTLTFWYSTADNFLATWFTRNFIRRLDNVASPGQDQVYFGRPNPLQEHCVDVEICPDLVLAGFAALGAAFLLANYIALTQQANGRKKRSTIEGSIPPHIPLHWLIFLHGMCTSKKVPFLLFLIWLLSSDLLGP